jgi:hypothetical protein
MTAPAYARNDGPASGRPSGGTRTDRKYAGGDRAERKRPSGGVLIAVASTLAAVLVLLAVYALAIARRPAAAPSPPAAPAVDTKLAALAHSYLAIADPANHRLDVANNGFTANERGNIAAAKADLRAEVATESLFDKQLAAIPFPPAIAAIARAMIRANQARGALTARQARSRSLAQLRLFDQRHRAADAAVEAQVRLIRKALKLPPASTS